MTRSARIALLLSALCGATSQAQPYKKLVNQAAESLEQAEQLARRSGGQCRRGVVASIDAATDHVYDLRKNRGDAQQVKLELNAVASNAALSGCPSSVTDSIQQAIEIVEDVRAMMWREHRGRHDDDDDDERGRPPYGAGFAQLAPIAVQNNAAFEGEPAVRISVPELRLTGLKGRGFYLGARFRSVEGEWNEWVTTQQWSVPSDPFVWKNAFQHFFPYSALAEDDFSNGRFIAGVAVFDANGQILATREIQFRANVPQLPSPQMPMPPPVQSARDCGTGNDIGCSMARDGQWPMEGMAFNGLMQSLRSNPNEMLRVQTLETIFARNVVTAIQFGLMLDLFQNEMLRLNVAQTAARRVVNPQHALVYATKWSNSMLAAQYTQIMASQQNDFPRSPLPPGSPPPPPRYPQQPPPMQPLRDCGTGNDPDCQLTTRNGTPPMDALTYQGVMATLRGEFNEITRRDVCITMLRSNALTSQQFGPILDLFRNDFLRLEVAKAAFPRLVNPQHALGFASKFQSLIGKDYTDALMRQVEKDR